MLHLKSYHASAEPVSVSEPTTEPIQTSLRDQIYNSTKEEKTSRAEEFSAIKRALSKDVVVIADGLNYIKGYRYQIWCEAKAAGTRCCVVHVAAREDECKAWNDERLRAAGRGEEVEDTELRNEPAQGKDGLGEMLPESHTAIYGDRIVAPISRSRTSSMDGASDDNEKPQAEDTMTLKSLYLRDRPSGAQYEEKENKPTTTPFLEPSSKPNAPQAPHASADPPPPSYSHPYKPSTLTSLCMRYEPPSPFSRWDTPLFTVPTSDAHPPYPSIWEALFPPPSIHASKKTLSQTRHQAVLPRPDETVKQNAATILPPATDASALQTLESTTQRVATALLAAYRASPLAEREGEGDGDGDGGTLSFAVDDLSCEIGLPPGLALSQPMLQRLRRKYAGLQRGGIAHGVGSVAGGRRGVVEGFVRFLGREWGADDDE